MKPSGAARAFLSARLPLFNVLKVTIVLALAGAAVAAPGGAVSSRLNTTPLDPAAAARASRKTAPIDRVPKTSLSTVPKTSVPEPVLTTTEPPQSVSVMAIGDPVALMAINEGSAVTSSTAASIDSTVTDAVEMSFSPTFVQIDGGASYSCGVATDGSLWTWGTPVYGSGLVPAPVRIGADSDWASVSVGATLAGALKTNGELWIWSSQTYTTPQKVTGTYQSISCGDKGVGINASGNLVRFGLNVIGQVEYTILDYGTWLSASAGAYHYAAVKSGGGMYTWGSDTYGQRATGYMTYTTTTVPALVDTGYKAVWCGDNFTLGQKTDGSLYGAGQNNMGQTGYGSWDMSFPYFVPVNGGSTAWTQIAVGKNHTVALRSDGTLWAWGDNSKGQFGDGTTTVSFFTIRPKQTGTATNWTRVGAAGDTSYMSQGTQVFSTGVGTTGQLGDGTTVNRATPVAMESWETYAQHRPLTLRSIDGTHAVTVKYRDSVGSVLTLSDTIVLDVTAPSIACIINGGDTHTNSTSVTLTMVYFAPTDHATAIRVNGGAWVAPAQYVPATLSAGDGVKLVTVDAMDAAGNIGTYSTTITLDTTPPSGTMSINGGASETRFPDAVVSSAVSGASFMYIPRLWVSANGGTDHVMMIKSDGSLWGWGTNGSGQLGDGTTVGVTGPVAVSGSASWTSVDAAYNYTLGIRADGTLWSWGYNGYGQLGVGNTTSSSTPLEVPGGGTWRSVSGGAYHALGIRTDGTLWSWGYNSSGQLGDGTSSQRLTPVQVGGDTDWQSVSAGVYSSRAIKTDGTLWAWGDGTNTPTRVGTDSDWASVSSGYYASYGTGFTLATKTDGTLWSWGSVPALRGGALGLGEGVTSVASPTQVGSDTDWVSVTAGTESSFARKADGSLWAWGFDSTGELGQGTSNASGLRVWTPSRVGSASDWSLVAPTHYNTYALSSTGTVWAWGSGSGCAAGLNTSQPVTTPVRSGWTAYTATQPITLPQTGLVEVTIGYRDNVGNELQLTDTITYDPNAEVSMSLNGGATSAATTNLTVDSAVAGATQMRLGRKWQSIHAGVGYTMLHREDGPVEFSGLGLMGQRGDAQVTYRTTSFGYGGMSRPWAEYSAGESHSLALDTNGALWVWGPNTNGVLGLPGTTDALQPVNLNPGETYAHVSAGLRSSFAIGTDGSLWAWGLNTAGELGDGTTVSRTSPVRIGTDTDWADVSNWGGHTLALKTDGTLWAWGPNGSGQLGLGDTTPRLEPTRVGTGTGWRAISAAYDHSLAIDASGALWAWGANPYGQIGDGTTTTRTSPVRISSLVWKAVHTGVGSSFAIRGDGTLWAWGYNYSGQLGDGTKTQRTAPVRIGARTDWEMVSSGGVHDYPSYRNYFTVASTTDGRIFTWGSNAYGQLGDGTYTERLAPVEITLSPLVSYASSAALSVPWASGETTIHAAYLDAVGHLTWLEDSIFVAPAPPVISMLMPYDQLVVENATPEITAHVDVSPGGLPATIEVRIDGVVYPSTYDAALTHVVRAPTTGLSDDDVHTVQIKVTDSAGTVVTASSSFLLEGGPKMPHWDTPTDCRTCHGSTVPHDITVMTTGGETRCLVCHMGIHETRPESPTYYGCSCHTSGTDSRYLNWTHRLDPAKCRQCHTLFNAGFTPAVLETPGHRSDATACKPCHRSELRFEHVLRKTDAGVTLTCNTCHASAVTAVQNAIVAKDTACATCHPGVDHWPLHDEPALETPCNTCHVPNLLDEHIDRGVLCDTCHASVVPAVVTAIATGDGSCTACHGTSAGANHVFTGGPPVDKTRCSRCHWSTGTVGADLSAIHSHTSTWLSARTSCAVCHPSKSLVRTFVLPTFDGPYGAFATAGSTALTADEIHAAHVKGSSMAGVAAAGSYCDSCHAAATCDSCHGTIDHGDHTLNATSGTYGATPVTTLVAPGVLPSATNRKTMSTQPVTCTAAKCHVIASDGTLVAAPLCTDCH